MDRKKVMYIGIILIITVILSVTYFSYAFFTSTSEQHGKLNVVVGTLDYKIECEDLTNNSITLTENERKMINIKITSLNDINSNYELYYTTDNNDLIVGYSDDTQDQPSGSINSNQSKTITVIIKNNTVSSATVTFGVQGGFSSKTLTLAQGNSINTQLNMCPDTNTQWNFLFDPDGNGQGQIQTFEVPCDGNYKLEVWGARGGGATYGKGGYSTGFKRLISKEKVYIVVGGIGGTPTAGYNGGGSGGSVCGGGGGATHMANNLEGEGLLKNYASYKNEILIVAGGGGGCWNYSGRTAGHGGGLSGTSGTGDAAGGSGTQTNAGSYGGFGYGGSNPTTANYSGGGGGYYGGGVGYNGSAQSGCGGGGSGYIGGVTNGNTIAGNASMPTHDGTSNMTGNTSNGYARITYLGD